MKKNAISEEEGSLKIPLGPRYAVFVSISILMVVCSVWLGRINWPTVQAITLNLGLVLIAVVLIDQLWRFSGGNPIKQQIAHLERQIKRLSQSVDVIESSKNIGLYEVYDKQANFGSQEAWISLINSATSNVDVMGRTLFKWTTANDFKEVILKKIEEDKVSFRWLIMSRNNRFLPIIEEVDESSMLDEKLQRVNKLLISIYKQLPNDKKDMFKIRTFEHVPLNCSIQRIDDRIYVVQYLVSTPSDNCPLYCVKGDSSAWPLIFKQEFENVWHNSQDLVKNPADLNS